MISARLRAQFGLFGGGALLLAAMSIVLAGAFEKPNKQIGQTGSLAPTFRLPDISGNIVRLSSFRGSVVVLYFAPGPESAAVTQDIQRLAQLGNRYQSNKDVKLVSIFSGTDELSPTQSHIIEHLADRAGPRCITLRDPGYLASRKYSIEKTSTFVVIDAGGIIRYRGEVDDPSPNAPFAATSFTSTIDLLLAERPMASSTPTVLSNIK